MLKYSKEFKLNIVEYYLSHDYGYMKVSIFHDLFMHLGGVPKRIFFLLFGGVPKKSPKN